MHHSLPAGAEVVSIDQAPIRGSRRSNPTYTKLFDPIRKAFAKANGVKPALFSANSEGACPTCNGAGVVYTDLAMMAGVDLGPGAGHDGGRVVFEGTPAGLVAARRTLTGEHLAAYVGA